MKTYTKHRWLLILLALAAVLVACGGNDDATTTGNEVTVGDLAIVDAWARPPAMAGGNAAAYFVVRNDGDAADRLIAVSSPLAMAEMHESVMADDGTMTMNPVDGVDIPAGSSVAFERGGLHIMFMGVAEPPAVGDTIALTLVFQNAGEVTLDVPVRAE